jgi:hypothetical protein
VPSTTSSSPPQPTCDNVAPIKNGDFETGSLTPWRLSTSNTVQTTVSSGGYAGTNFKFNTFNFDYPQYLEMYQDIQTCGNTRFFCTYWWKWDKFYSVRRGGTTYVPYVRIWQGNTVIGNRYPESDADTGVWLRGSFEFTTPTDGTSRIWITAESPQNPGVNRRNALALDEIQCTAYN